MIRATPEAHQPAIITVQGRGGWFQGITLAGTVTIGGTAYVASTTSLSAGAIQIADVATPSLAVVSVPDRAKYMEVGAFGDGGTITTSPVLDFWRHHDLDQPVVAGGLWKLMPNLLGSATLTLDGTIDDGTGVAGASRYSIRETTDQQHLYDLRGAKLVVARLTTKGTANNWSLWHRFF